MQDLAPLAGRVAVVGSGIAGLITALQLAPSPVVLVTRAALGHESSSLWAQGGIAASLGPDDDPGQHLHDTLEAGAGLCDVDVARSILSGARAAIGLLEAYGVHFDRAAGGGYALGLEAAHGRHRIVHAGGDATGAVITAALVEAVSRTPSITCLTGVEARRVCVEGGAVSGLLLQSGPEAALLRTSRVVLATGGIGGLFDATTNPRGNMGQGVMMAARAGAVLADLEFVQFHPTAFDVPRALLPLPLVSEAVRGAGAWLVNDLGERFMAETPGAELAPRDVVARAIQAQIGCGARVYLDAAQALGDSFAARFPTINQLCHAGGIDPARDPIPVRPAAHYHMGGVETDRRGRTSVSGLWAVGECACTGLHGANRLASNSLLEAVVIASRAARDIADGPLRAPCGPEAITQAAPPPPTWARPPATHHLGLLREGAGLETAIRQLLPLVTAQDPASDAALVALGIACFALLRTETRGAHARTDFPLPAAAPMRRRMRLDDILVASQEVLTTTSPLFRRA